MRDGAAESAMFAVAASGYQDGYDGADRAEAVAN